MKTLIYTFAVATISIAASAQSNYYVASYGNDSNNCLAGSPCRTFKAAVSKADAFSTIAALDSAEFGPFTLTKAMTIDGGSHGAFVSCGNCIMVQVSPGAGVINTPVVIRNLSILLAGANTAGLQATLSAGSLTLDHVSISASETYDNAQGSYGIVIVTAPGVPVRLKGVTISGLGHGIDVASSGTTGPAATATLEDVSVDAPDVGLRATDTDLNIRNSSFVNSSNFMSTGLVLGANQTSPVSMVESTQIGNQQIGIHVYAGTVRLSNCNITRNGTGVLNSGGSVISFRNNVFAGNTTDGTLSLSSSLK